VDTIEAVLAEREAATHSSSQQVSGQQQPEQQQAQQQIGEEDATGADASSGSRAALPEQQQRAAHGGCLAGEEPAPWDLPAAELRAQPPAVLHRLHALAYEEGALALAHVHAPVAELGWVAQALDALATELRRRMAAAGACMCLGG
jgi:hypothetical protein